MTRTCTFKVSPARKSGTSLRSDSASSVCKVFIVVCFLRGWGPRALGARKPHIVEMNLW
jgi:hypothetical protein